MKNLIIIAAVVLSLMGVKLGAQSKIVERPAFDFWNSQTIEIDKIELSETATVFYIDAYFRPHNWIRIDSKTYIRETGNAEKLIITGSEGINMDEEFFMPESGKASFKLFFPPVGKHVTKIDFIENDCDDCFKIWGIYLDGTIPAPYPLPASVSQDKTRSEMVFPEPKIKKANATFSGKVFGNNIPKEILKGYVYTFNPLTKESKDIEIPIQDDGTFKLDIPLIITPSIIHIDATFYRGIFSLQEGDMNELYIDFTQKCLKESRYQKERASANSFAYNISKNGISLKDLNDYEKTFEHLYYLDRQPVELSSPGEYKEIIYNRLKALKQITDTFTLASGAKKTLHNNWDLINIDKLLNYEQQMFYTYCQTNNISYEDSDTVTFKAETPDKEYYKFLKDFDLNNPYYLNSGYSNVIETIRSNKTIGLPDKGQMSLNQWQNKVKEILKVYTGTDSGLFYDMLVINEYIKQLNNLKHLSSIDKKEIEGYFSDKTISSMLISENERIEKIIDQNKNMAGVILHETPDVENEKIMDEILSKYKGKVVFVDFWATWCGPCIKAMKTAEPVKAEFADKDVVFLYLTGETSPAVDFQKMLPTIHGEHFRVTKEIWDYWGKAMNVRGVPMYIIFDKEGKETHRNTGFMGVEKMKEWINESL